MHPFLPLKHQTVYSAESPCTAGLVTRQHTGRAVVRIRQDEIFLFSKTSIPSLGSSKPSIQRVPGFFPGAKRPGSDGNPSTPSCAEIKNEWSYTSTPPICFHGEYCQGGINSILLTRFVKNVGFYRNFIIIPN